MFKKYMVPKEKMWVFMGIKLDLIDPQGINRGAPHDASFQPEPDIYRKSSVPR